MFVISERSIDGGWHHIHADGAGLRRRLALFSCWNLLLHEVIPPAGPVLLVTPERSGPLSRVALDQVAATTGGQVLCDPVAAELWSDGFASAGALRHAGAATPLICYEPYPNRDYLTELQHHAMATGEHPSFGSEVQLDCDWPALAAHARKVWRRLIPLLPFQILRQAPLMWPGLIAYSRAHVGASTIADLMSCDGRWQLPVDSNRNPAGGRPNLQELHGSLSQTQEGRMAYDKLVALSAADFDSICIQERHLTAAERHAVGTALDRLSTRHDQCLSMSPLVRSTRIAATTCPARTAHFAAELGVERFGDLGRYCFGFRVAHECPTRKQSPSDVVKELTRAALRLRDSALPRRGRGRPRKAQQTLSVQVELPMQPADRTLKRALRLDCATMDARQSEVLRRRLGLDCTKCTLAEIGVKHGVTRERVRQLEVAAWRSATSTRALFGSVLGAIQARLAMQRRPMLVWESPLPGTECELERHDLGLLHHLINMWASNLLQMMRCKGGGYLVMSATSEPLSAIQAILAHALQRWPADPELRAGHLSVEHYFQRLPVDVQGGYMAALRDPSGPFGELLRPRRPLATATLLSVLESSPHPLTLTEAMAAAKSRFKVDITPSRARMCLSDVAYPLGGDAYCLGKHLRIPGEVAATIGTHADSLVRGSERQQWRVASIRDALAGTDAAMAMMGLTDFELAAVLREHSRALAYAGRLVFRADKEERRTTGPQVALRVLERAGRPLLTQAIVEAVRSEIPGITYQVRPTRHLARIGLGIWGLRGRDFEIDDERLDSILEWLKIRIVHDGLIPYKTIANCPEFAEARKQCDQLHELTIADLAQASGFFRLRPGKLIDGRDWLRLLKRKATIRGGRVVWSNYKI